MTILSTAPALRTITRENKLMMERVLAGFNIVRDDKNRPVSWKAAPYSVGLVAPLVDALHLKYGCTGNESDKKVTEAIESIEKMLRSEIFFANEFNDTILNCLENEYARLSAKYSRFA